LLDRFGHGCGRDAGVEAAIDLDTVVLRKILRVVVSQTAHLPCVLEVGEVTPENSLILGWSSPGRVLRRRCPTWLDKASCRVLLDSEDLVLGPMAVLALLDQEPRTGVSNERFLGLLDLFIFFVVMQVPTSSGDVPEHLISLRRH
jgi:hypothetical protein